MLCVCNFVPSVDGPSEIPTIIRRETNGNAPQFVRSGSELQCGKLHTGFDEFAEPIWEAKILEQCKHRTNQNDLAEPFEALATN